jgi:hypothetical protein
MGSNRAFKSYWHHGTMPSLKRLAVLIDFYKIEMLFKRVLYFDVGCSTLLWNVGRLPVDYMVLHCGRQPSSSVSACKVVRISTDVPHSTTCVHTKHDICCLDAIPVIQLCPALDMGRYMPVYRTGTSFFPKFHTGTYQYILHPFMFFLFFWRHVLVSLLRSVPALLNFHF